MKALLSTALAAAVCCGLALRAEDAASSDKGQCPVSGKDAVADQKKVVDGYTYYFCCGGCPDAFDKEKHAAPGNYQLAVTKQLKQKGCPFSGKEVDKATALKLGKSKVEVAFCCGMCKGKVEGAADDKAKIEMVFKDVSKGFEKAK